MDAKKHNYRAPSLLILLCKIQRWVLLILLRRRDGSNVLYTEFLFSLTYIVSFTSTAISEGWCRDPLLRGEKMEKPSHRHTAELWFRIWLAWLKNLCALHVTWLRGGEENARVCLCECMHAMYTESAHTHTCTQMHEHQAQEMGSCTGCGNIPILAALRVDGEESIQKPVT